MIRIRALLCLGALMSCTSLYSMHRAIDMICPRLLSSSQVHRNFETKEELLISLCRANDFDRDAEDPFEVIKMLLEHRLNVNATDPYDNTPLHYAAVHGNKDLALLLLSNGAKVNLENWNSSTPLNIAIREGSLELVHLFIEWGAQVNMPMKETEITPLMVAAMYGKKSCCSVLVSHGALLDQVNAHGETALMVAKRAPYNTSVVQYLESLTSSNASTKSLPNLPKGQENLNNITLVAAVAEKTEGM